jgi:hypothetical protein
MSFAFAVRLTIVSARLCQLPRTLAALSAPRGSATQSAPAPQTVRSSPGSWRCVRPACDLVASNRLKSATQHYPKLTGEPFANSANCSLQLNEEVDQDG